MAKGRKGKSSKKRTSWDTPVQRILRFDLYHNSTVQNAFGYHEDFHYIDLAQNLSAVNSRLYRQGKVYHIANITVHDYSQDCFIKFCTLPNTWGVKTAWKLGLQNWMNMNRQLPDETLSAALHQGKWSDYRIWFNDDHRTDPDVQLFRDVENNVIQQNEYKHTAYVSTDGSSVDTFEAHMMGDHTGAAGAYTSISLLAAYDEVRKLRQAGASAIDPTVLTGVWTNLMEKQSEFDDIATELSTDYDYPPYDKDTLPGMKEGVNDHVTAPWCAREAHLSNVSGIMAAVGGFQVPCGLLAIETASRVPFPGGDVDLAIPSHNVIGLEIELVPGPYKGVKADSMGRPKQVPDKSWRVS